jgi:hypothetical protein
LVAVVLLAVLGESDLDEVESEEELPDSLEDAVALVESDPWCELLREPLPELRRESLRESLR